jgi:hypothetical protein
MPLVRHLTARPITRCIELSIGLATWSIAARPAEIGF